MEDRFAKYCFRGRRWHRSTHVAAGRSRSVQVNGAALRCCMLATAICEARQACRRLATAFRPSFELRQRSEVELLDFGIAVIRTVEFVGAERADRSRILVAPPVLATA